MKRNLIEALGKYPLEGWDDEIEFESFSKGEVIAAIEYLLDEHSQFPVPWDRSENHPGLFVVTQDDRHLGFSGFPAPVENEKKLSGGEPGAAPAFGLAAEEFPNSRHLAEVIATSHFQLE
jgi:hypothetical protein